MASYLQDSSSKFQKQQVKSQSTRAHTAAKAGNPGSMPSSMSTLANAKSAASPAKFSELTDQLQEINSIRKAPVGAQIRRVINLLDKRRQALTPDEINKACHVDVKGNKAVFDSLRNNLKVHYESGRFSYKSTHQLENKSQLLKLIKKYREGTPVIDLKDSYATVMDDLQALKASGEIWVLSNFDSQEDIAYPNDPRVVITVDGDLKQLFRGIEVPCDMLDIERELEKNGMKPATDTSKRSATAEIQGFASKPKTEKKKQPGISKRTKLTNAHLPELFKNLNVLRS